MMKFSFSFSLSSVSNALSGRAMEKLLTGVFYMEYREKRRKRMDRSWIADYIWYSSCYDYRILRLLINWPIGFGLATAMYYLAWKQLNVADWHPVLAPIFQWLLIIACAFAFALSPVFRCATVCTLLGALGKNGQGLAAMLVLEKISQGPVQTILENFYSAANMSVCHLQLQSEIATQRISFVTGPMEKLLEEKLGMGVEKGKKVIRTLKAIIDPVRDELKKSEEEENLDQSMQGAQALSVREKLLDPYAKRTRNDKATRAVWTRLREKSARILAHRMTARCRDVFDAGIRICHERFADIKDKCYSALPWLIRSLVCPALDVVNLCQSTTKHQYAIQNCEAKMSSMLNKTPDFASRVESMNELSDEMVDQLKMQLHFVAVEGPRWKEFQHFQDIRIQVNAAVTAVKIFITTIKELIHVLMILLIYLIFRDCCTMIGKYLDDINFKNVYVTGYFWRIDKKKETAGLPCLRRLTKAERTRHGLMRPVGLPTLDEVEAVWQPMVKWTVLLIIVIFVLVVNVILYRVLYQLTTNASTMFFEEGIHQLTLTVHGEGFVADLVRSVLQFNASTSLDSTFGNDECIFDPRPPDWKQISVWIILPLLLMLLMQVMFNFVIRRFCLFVVVEFIFRRRSKTRTIQLYNTLLFARLNGNRRARARIRFQVKRRLLQPQKWIDRNWLTKNVVDKVFNTGQCLMCLEKLRVAKLIICESVNCRAGYCSICWTEMNKLCYACLAEEGVVDSQTDSDRQGEMVKEGQSDQKKQEKTAEEGVADSQTDSNRVYEILKESQSDQKQQEKTAEDDQG